MWPGRINIADIFGGKLVFNPGANEHGAGSQYSSFAFRVRDNGGTANGGINTSAQYTMRIDVTAVNDPAVVGGDLTGSVKEDVVTTATGVVTVSDVDTGEARFEAIADARGAYGTFSFDHLTGRWAYLLDNSGPAVQSLVDGEVRQDTFTIRTVDGTEKTITVLINGSRDTNPLSRSPKVLQQLSEPEVFGCHAGLAMRLLRRQRQNPGCGVGGQGIDGRGLPVGCDEPLELAPELIHRAQFRRLPRQPHEANAQPVRQRLGLRGGVGARPVTQQPEPAGAAIPAPQLAQELLSVGLTGMLADQHHTARASQVDRPKQHPLGIAAGDRHNRLPALERPGRPQRRKQPQQRPVEAQQPIARLPARLQPSDDAPFFCAR